MAQGSLPSLEEMEVDLRRELNGVFGKFEDFAEHVVGPQSRQLFGVISTPGVMRGLTPYSPNRLPSNVTPPSASHCLQEMRNVPPLIPPLQVGRNEIENSGCASEASSSHSHMNDDENENIRKQGKRKRIGEGDGSIKREKKDQNKMLSALFDDDNDDDKGQREERKTRNNDNSPRQGIRRMVMNMQVEPLIPPIDAKKGSKKKDDEMKSRREEEDEREKKRKKERDDSERRRRDREEDERRKRKEEDERRKRKDEEEERRKREKKEDEERRRKKEDEEKRKRDEEEKKRREEDERRKKKEEDDKLEEERLRKERRKKEKEERKRKEKEEEDRKKKEEEERIKKEEEEMRKREIEEREREETARRLEEERKKEAERLRKEEEIRKREEDERRKREEEERKKKEEEELMQKEKEKEARREKKKEEEKRRLKEEEKEKKRRDDEKSRKEKKEKDKKGSLSLDNLSQSKLEALKEKERERRKKENGLADIKDERAMSGSPWNISKKKEWKEEKEKKSRKETDRIVKKEVSSARSSPLSSKNSSRVATPIPPIPLSLPSTSTYQHVPPSSSSSIDYSFPLCPSSSCLASALAPSSLSPLEIRGDYEGYTNYAKEKKHRGDAAQDRVIRFFHYMECCVYFALSASTIHPDRSSDRELTMAAAVLKDTVDLIKHAMIIFEKENNGHLMTRAKILCLRTQSVLNYHMYFVRSNKYPRRSDTLASLESQVTEIPRASPRKEENGVKKTEKGEDKNSATPSSSYNSITSPSSNMVSMPMSLWKMKTSVTSTLSHLETAHRLWNESIKLMNGSEKHYFNTVDNLILRSYDWGCPLHVGSSLLHLSHFVNTTVSWMRLEYEGERSR